MSTCPTFPIRLMLAILLFITIQRSVQSTIDQPNADNKEALQANNQEKKVYPETSGGQSTGSGSCRTVDVEESAKCFSNEFEQIEKNFGGSDFRSVLLPLESINFGARKSLNGKPVDNKAQLEKSKSALQSSAPAIIKAVGDLCENLTETAISCSSPQLRNGDADVLDLMIECSEALNSDIVLRTTVVACEEGLPDIVRGHFICLTDVIFDFVNAVMEFFPAHLLKEYEPANDMSNNNSPVKDPFVAGNYSCVKDLVTQVINMDHLSPEKMQTPFCNLINDTVDCVSPQISQCGGEKTVVALRRMLEEMAAVAIGPC